MNETDQILMKYTFDFLEFYLHLQIDLQVVPQLGHKLMKHQKEVLCIKAPPLKNQHHQEILL